MTAPTLYEKLSTIQCELKAPKSQYNSFGKYHYRSCEDILEAVKPLCNKQKTTLTISDEIVCVEGWHYVKATARLYDWSSGEAIENIAYARESVTKKGMDDSQVTGSTSTYARKYALNGLFNIDDTKDNDDTKLKNEQTERAKKEDQEQRKSIEKNIKACIQSLIDEFEVDIEGDAFQSTMKKAVGYNTLTLCDMPLDKLQTYEEKLLGVLTNKRNKAKEQASATQ